MLAWPALALLKRSMPKCEISVLVPKYTQEVAQSCPWIDNVILDAQDIHLINRENFDAVLTLFSTTRVGWQVFKGRIPIRVAPATKFAQVFYNNSIVQRRSRSERPEFIYNVELASHLLSKLGIPAANSEAPFWPISKDEKNAIRQRLANDLKIDTHQPWFFLHSGSGGSANNLSVEQYADLVCRLDERLDNNSRPKPCWVLTCGPGEEDKVHSIFNKIKSRTSSVVYESKNGLSEFSKSISSAQLMVAGSTGPLHVAGALDVPTVGFFPAKRSSTSLRWRPCNTEGNTLGISCPEGPDGRQDDMSKINPETAAETIANWLIEKGLS